MFRDTFSASAIGIKTGMTAGLGQEHNFFILGDLLCIGQLCDSAVTGGSLHGGLDVHRQIW